MTPFILLVLGTQAAAEPLPYPLHERTLDNGFRVVAMQTPSDGVVASRIWMSVGSRDETEPGRTGYAHFFEHLMFHGTPANPRGAREDQLVRIGAEDNAWTWFDETVYTTLLPSEELDAYLETEADRFRSLGLTVDGVRREAGAVYGEFRKGQSSPSERLTDMLYATAFTAHTYSHSTIGHEADVAGMPEGFDAATGFFARHYRPDRAVLILAGDIDPDQALALAEKHFGTWQGQDVEPPPPIVEEPEQVEIRRSHVDWEGPTAARLALGWKVPAHRPDSEDLALLELVAQLLDSPTGPLYRRLVKEEAVALAVSAGRDDFVDPGLFRVQVLLHDPKDLSRAEALVHEVISDLATADPTTLEDVRTHTLYTRLLSMEHPARLADALGWQLRRGTTTDALTTWTDTLRTADLARLPEVLDATFGDSTLTVVTLAPGEQP